MGQNANDLFTIISDSWCCCPKLSQELSLKGGAKFLFAFAGLFKQNAVDDVDEALCARPNFLLKVSYVLLSVELNYYSSLTTIIRISWTSKNNKKKLNLTWERKQNKPYHTVSNWATYFCCQNVYF